VFVVGPTASGKTSLAVALARRFGGEVVSADSRQVYRGLDIGTGKDLAEYGTGPDRVPSHLLDVVEPDADYHVFRFLAEARQALREITARGRLPIVAGGSGLYLQALLSGYSLEGGAPDPGLRQDLEGRTDRDLLECLRREAPDLAARVDSTQRCRLVRAVEIARTRRPAPDGPWPEPPLDALLLGPYYPRRTMHARIEARLEARLASGLVAEVAGLHARGLSWARLEWLGLEYRFVALHLQGHLTYGQMRETLLARIRRLCKAQDGWFRRFEREGWPIHWLPAGDPVQAGELVRRFLAGEELPPPVLRLNDTLYGPRTQ
jgi:tRNA dimethylallyltransferase